MYLNNFAQINVDISAPYNNPTFLVNNVLLGSGVVASNHSFQGDSSQIAFFDGPTNLGIDSGLVMSTGDSRALIPSYTGGLNTPFPNTVTDPDLLNVANSVPPLIGQSFSVNSINDVAVLEFDFIPTSDTVSFRYIFGSNEYLTWVNSQYNDVFGFFISGPGITGPYASPAAFPNGSINIANVPNSSPLLPVTISSVNNVLNPIYYIDNQTVTPQTVDCNGFTTIFTAKAAVQCGETYHIRLAIADGSDQILDTWVFLEAGSFTSPELDLTNSLGIDSTNTIEIPCYSTIDLTANITLNADILWSTGDTSSSITVGPGDYWAQATDSLNCAVFSDTIHIVLPSLPSVNLGPDQTVCVMQTTDINTSISGGTAPFAYLWSDGSTSSSINVGGGSYSVTVTDANSCDAYDDALVLEEIMPVAGDDGNITLCDNADAFSLYNVLGGSPFATGSWQSSNGTPSTGVFNPATQLSEIYTYVVPGVVCPNDTSYVDVTIHEMPNTNAGRDTTICGPVYEMIAIPDVGIGTWTTAGGTSFAEVNNPTTLLTVGEFGFHTFTWTEDNNGCISSDDVIVQFIDPPFNLGLTPSQHSMCPDDSVTISISDEFDSYLWFRNNIPLVSSNSAALKTKLGGSYKVQVTSDICVAVSPPTQINIFDLLDPTILTHIDTALCPINPPIQLESVTSGGQWKGQGMIYTGEFIPSNAGVGEHWISYTLTNNCHESDSILIELGCDMQIFIPNAFTPNSDFHNETLITTGVNIIDFEMQIYNRWGEMMFHTNDINHQWDGTYKGRTVPVGVYSYIINAYGKDDQHVSKEGNISVLK